MRLLTLGLIAFALAACSFNKDNSVGPDPAIARQNSNVNNIYGPLVGTYTGTQTIGNSVQDVRVVLSIRSESATNSDGTPTTKLVPIGTFTRLNPAGPDVAMKWSFTPETSAFNLTAIESGGSNANGNNGGGKSHRDDDVKVVDGTLIDQHIVARLNNFDDIQIGVLDLRKSSDQSSDPGSRNERLRRLYESVSGQYCGTIRDPYDTKKPQIISVDVRMGYTPDPTSPTGTRPYLWGYYDRLDKPPHVLDLTMSVVYDTPPNVTIYGKGLGKYSVTFNGVLLPTSQDNGRTVPGYINAELITGVDGKVGTLTLRLNDPVCNTPRPAGF